MLSNQLSVEPLPEDVETRLRGFQALFQNPYYLHLLQVLTLEEAGATDRVFRGSLEPVSEHFKEVGRALGLVRIRDLHLGLIEDLKQQKKESDENETTPKS